MNDTYFFHIQKKNLRVNVREDGVLVVTTEFVEQDHQTLTQLGTHKLEHYVYSLCQQIVYFRPVAILACSVTLKSLCYNIIDNLRGLALFQFYC